MGAELTEAVHDLDHAHRVGGDDRLGDLELEHRRADVPLREQLVDIAREAEVEQVRGAEVDGDRHAQALVTPARDGPARVQDAERQRAHQAGLLGERQERARAEEAELRVVPAHECLGAGDLAALEVELRLVVQDELAGVDGVRSSAIRARWAR